MAETFFIVLRQAVIILAFILTGFVCGKRKILDDSSIAGLNKFVVTFVITCACFSGFLVERTPERVKSLLLGLALAVGLHIMNYAVSRLIFRRKTGREWICISSSLLTNCGFIGFPMLTAVLGENGIFIGLPFLAVMTITAWTGGVMIISEDRHNMSLKRALASPPVLGTLAGLAVFLTGVSLPGILTDTVGYFTAMNTPLPMIVVGYYITKADFRPLLRDGRIWLAIVTRLLLLPVMGMLLLFAGGLRGDMLVAMTICNAAPAAAVINIQAAMFGRDAGASSSLTSLETILSVATMPPVVALSACLAKL